MRTALARKSPGRATSYELRATSYELRATSYELRATSYELRATSYELRATSYELRATSYELRATSYELRATSYELRATSYELRATSYELRFWIGQAKKFPKHWYFCEAAVGAVVRPRTALARKSPGGRSGISGFYKFQKERRINFGLCPLATSIRLQAASHKKRGQGVMWLARPCPRCSLRLVA